MKKLFLPVLGASMLLLAACGNQGGTPAEKATNKTDNNTTKTVDAGSPEAVYQKNCMNCHGGNLQGGFAPALQNVGSKMSKDQIKQIIENGKGSMPAQKDYIEPAALDQLATWLSEKK